MNGICHQGAWPHEIVQGGCTDGGVGVGFLSRGVLVCIKSDCQLDLQQYV